MRKKPDSRSNRLAEKVRLHADVTSMNDVHCLVDSAWNRFGKANVLVNNAGIAAAYVTDSTFVIDGGLMRNYHEQ